MTTIEGIVIILVAVDVIASIVYANTKKLDKATYYICVACFLMLAILVARLQS